jgi:3-dehydroquinate synthase
MSPAPSETHRNEVIRQKLAVPFEYPVVFTRRVFDPTNPALLDVFTEREPQRRHRVLVVMDAGFREAWPEVPGEIKTYFDRHSQHLELVGTPVEIPGGEASKTDPAIIDRLHELFHRHRIDRHSFVLILGGGAVIDAAGYAAATCHRGLRTIRMPTTVLGQNDSGVGVKNGINAFGAKNFLGTFVPPFAVVSDATFLERLPRREAVAGLAEAVKVALIRDPAFFDWIEANAAALADCELEALDRAIRRCAELHLRHIAQGGDPFEHGSARPLDFGHWAAHKLEGLSRHEVRHGEAVAMGILLDSRYSLEIGLLGEADFNRIHRTIARLGLPRWDERLLTPGPTGSFRERLAILGGLDDFREHLGGDLTITLLRGIGRAVDAHDMDESAIVRALDWMRAQRHHVPA